MPANQTTSGPSDTEIPAIPIGEPIGLPAVGSWPSAVHVFERPDAFAIRAALAARRPLLVRGEPGVGKSQLARAAAQVLDRLFLSEVVHARTEPEDLKWRFDAVARLGEAQTLGALMAGGSEIDIQQALDPTRFLSPGPLWWTFNYDGAQTQNQQCFHRVQPPVRDGWSAAQGVVLLIDEIDKAEADLPNGLLEALGNGGFDLPHGGSRTCPKEVCQHGPAPLVIVTTNEERELPTAFVRRCLVLRLELPKRKETFVDFLDARGERHGFRCAAQIRRQVAEQLWEDRERARRQGPSKPGQAEYLDILRALDGLTAGVPEQERTSRQRALLTEIAGFALHKAAVADSGGSD